MRLRKIREKEEKRREEGFWTATVEVQDKCNRDSTAAQHSKHSTMDYNTVLQALALAASPIRTADQTAAEQQLKQWETQQGFHFHLQSVYVNANGMTNGMANDIPLQVRWLAVILLKNGVEKYWRPTRINAITKAEKHEIRKRLFNTLSESNNQLAIQNAHLISRIARIDFPAEWPTLFEDMVAILESSSMDGSNDTLIRLNNLMIIANQVVKILATVRIGRARVMMQTKAPILLPHLIKFYTLLFDRWINNVNNASNVDVAVIETGYIFLKVIRRLVVDGYALPNADKLVQEFMELSLQHFQRVLLLHDTNKQDQLKKYIMCYVKLYYNLVSENTSSFVLLTSSKHILLTLLSLLQQKAVLIYGGANGADGTDDEESDFWEKIAIKSFTIMKNVTNYAFKEPKFTTNLSKQPGVKEEMLRSIELLKTDFFTVDLVANIIDLITNHYLKLSRKDLENWSHEPEEWFNEEMSVNWEFQVRRCAENYFQDLSIHFNEFIAQFIMNKVNKLNTDEQLDMISKDSILCIFQLSSHSIASQCDFNQLLTNYFIPLVQQAQQTPSNEEKMLKRRVCLIISEWTNDKVTVATRVEIYKFLTELLTKDSGTGSGTGTNDDVVVKLTALQTLKFMVDDWEFRKRHFEPFIGDCIKACLVLLDRLSLIECKIFVLNALSVLIERCSTLISPSLLTDVVNVVPLIWQSSNTASEMIIKNSLLRILKDLVVALNKDSSLVHDVVIPLIPLCCDPKSEYYSLLCEDGLELWSAILKTIDTNAVLSTKLLDPALFEMLVNALVNWTEILPLTLTIIRSYFLISFEIFNNDVGMRIFQVLAGYLRTMRDDSVFLTASILDVAIMQDGGQGQGQGENEKEKEKAKMYENLVASGLFEAMVEYVSGVNDGDSGSALCETRICLPLLRFLHDRVDIFLSSISSSYALYMLLNTMVKLAKNAFDPKVRKLFNVGMLTLYTKTEYLTNGRLLNGNDGANIEYEFSQMDKGTGIACLLCTFVHRIVVESALIFAEEVSENGNGDLRAYYRQTAYDDAELQPVDDNNEAAEAEVEGEESEYAAEVAVPVTHERERYTALLRSSNSPVHGVSLTGLIREIGGVVYALLDKTTVEEIQRLH